jgi:hypothetical protein
MINEEGGTDPLEFRFHAVTDRVATTGTTWLGLTVGCAQCHTHKFDPIPHRDYFRMMAFLNNADEPVLDLPDPVVRQKRARAEREIAERTAQLADRFPLPQPIRWNAPGAGGTAKAVTLSGAGRRRPARRLDPDRRRERRQGHLHGDARRRPLLRAGNGDPSGGTRRRRPGEPRAGAGAQRQLRLSEITATVAPKDEPDKARAVRFARAEADHSQDGYPAAGAIDGKADTGWAILGSGNWNTDRTLTLHLAEPVATPAAGARWTFTLKQEYGGRHTLGRFRLSLGQAEPDTDPRPIEARRREQLQKALAAWKKPLEEKAVRWQALTPVRATANVPVLRILPDASVLSTSDITKRDVYDIDFAGAPVGVTALRIEVLPHPSLPGGGPGRVYYEGSSGDFWFSEMEARVNGRPAKLARAVASFGNAARWSTAIPFLAGRSTVGRARPTPRSSRSRNPSPRRAGSRCGCSSSATTRRAWDGSGCR